MNVAGTVPYPWPYDSALDAGATALLICGAQRQFVEASQGVEPVRLAIANLARSVTSRGGSVLASHHLSPTTTRTRSFALSVADDPRSHLDQLVTAELADVRVVTCAGYDAFYGSSLEAVLRARSIRCLVVVGFAAEIVVDSTLRSANDRGFECLVVSDAVAPIDPDLLKHALASVTMSGGIFGALGTSDAVLAALAST